MRRKKIQLFVLEKFTLSNFLISPSNVSNQFCHFTRIRPQLPREIKEMSGICTTVTPNKPQIILDTDRAFTFDYVFDTTTEQSAVYNTAVAQLVEESLKGYNVTVLAYGQVKYMNVMIRLA